MIFIVVDEEPFARKQLEDAVRAARADVKLKSFSRAAEVQQYARKYKIDVAFMDIESENMNGLTLAKNLKEIQPEVKIIFVSGCGKYAYDAYQIHASGYLLKPVTAERIQRELICLYGEMIQAKQSRIRIQTFGGFEIYVDDRPVRFRRAKARELLACLVDRGGAPITTGEACALLWEDAGGDRAKKNYFRTIVKDMREALQEVGAEELLIIEHNRFAIDPKQVDCDVYRFMAKDPAAVGSYRHNYMPCYSWAEFSIGRLEKL